MIGITGTFPGTPKAAQFSAKTFALPGKGPISALDPALVANVAVFCGTGGYMTGRVADGSFSVAVDRKQPAALLFIGLGGNNLGYLSLGNGMESIPLNMADTGLTSIDLQTLTSSGNIIEPGHNPVGAEIPMTASEVMSYVFSNGALGSILKAPDVDGDGVVDVAAGQFYRYTVRYDTRAGNFGSNLTPTLANPITVNSYVFEAKLSDTDLDFPSEVSFNGPPGSGIESATSWLKQSFGSDGCSYCAPAISNPSIPPAGTYVVGYKTKTLTFHLPSQAEVTKYLAIPVPTVHLNDDGTVNKITLEYRLSDGSMTVDPKALILNLNLQIDVDVGNGGPSVQRYSSPNVPPDTTEFVITEPPIQWSSVTSMRSGYQDVFGNQIGVIWNKP